MRFYLSLLCGKIHRVQQGSELEADAIRRGMVRVPDAELRKVSNMNLHERRRWASSF